MNGLLQNVPTENGCYIFRDEKDQILYIGKAKNLRQRISNHLREKNKSKFQNLIKSWEIILTNNVKEALVLEQNLIKNYQPKFNYCLRDDRSYPYIRITGDKNPRYLLVNRIYKIKNKKDTYFGPFPDGSKAAEMLQILERIFPLANCKGNLKKPCLYYSLGQCSGYCFKEVETEYYSTIKKKINDFFKGKIQKVRKIIQKSFQKSLANYEFELAKKEKKMLDNIDFFVGKQNIEFKDYRNYDFLGFYLEDNFLYSYLLLYRYGKLSNTEARIFNIQDISANEILESYLYQFYQKNTPPKVLYLPQPIEGIKIVGEEMGFICKVPCQGRKKEILKMAQQNAQQIKKRHYTELLHPDDKIELLEKIGKFLQIPIPFLIETLDISNLFQKDVVAGFLNCINGNIAYNRSKIYYLKEEPGSDVAWIKAACELHYKNKPINLLPQLLIVDGGKPQLSAILEIWKRLNLNIPLIGLVKNQKHQTEKIIAVDFLKKQTKQLEFSDKINIKKFFTNLQEKVHRYVIKKHRKLHLESILKK